MVAMSDWASMLAARLDRCTQSSSAFQTSAGAAHVTTPCAPPSLSSSSLRFVLWLMRVALQLPWLLFSSDPAAFLPPKQRKHQKHALTGQHASGGAGGGRGSYYNGSGQQTAAAVAGMSGSSSSVRSSVAQPSGGAASDGRDRGSHGEAAPLPQPFLSTSSFPIPSAQLLQAQYCYNLHEPPTLLAQMANAASSAVAAATGAPPVPPSASPPLGGWRTSAGHEALNMYQHVLKKKKKKKYTLVLDLDETLVHTTDKAIAQYDCRVEIHTKKAHRVFYILKRPFLDVFLVTLSQYFEIVIFTASIRRYADAVIDLIDLHHVVDRRFFRQSCIKSDGSFLKDLRVVSGPDLRRTLLVDNSPVAYSLQEENALPIATWYDDPTDTALRDLIPFLLSLRAMDDVRALLYRRLLLQRMAERNTRNAGQEQAPQLSVASTLVEADEEDEDAQQAAALRRMRKRTTV